MKLSPSVQESLITLMCYDQEAITVILSLMPPDQYDPYYKDVAIDVAQYYKSYNKVPGNTHTADIFATLAARWPKNKPMYQEIFTQVAELKDSVNRDYIVKEATLFARFQKISAVGSAAVELAGKETVTENDIVKVENEINRLKDTSAKLSTPGLHLKNSNDALSFLREDAAKPYHTGIKEFDALGLGPTKGKLYVFVAPSGTGKTWFMDHLAVNMAVVDRAKVLVVTLEMSEDEYTQRMIQTMFGVAKRAGDERYVKFKKDEAGNTISFAPKKIKPKLHFEQPDIEAKLRKKLKYSRHDIRVKSFATGEMTMEDLEAFIVSLEWQHKWKPDAVLLDYADLGKYDSRHEAPEIARIYREFRGMGQRRDFAAVTPTQVNRPGGDVKRIKKLHMSLSIEKINIADYVVAYNQTDVEKSLGLCRLEQLKGRSDKDGFLVMCSQAYGIGQFAIDSVRMPDQNYWDVLQSHGNND